MFIRVPQAVNPCARGRLASIDRRFCEVFGKPVRAGTVGGHTMRIPTGVSANPCARGWLDEAFAQMHWESGKPVCVGTVGS